MFLPLLTFLDSASAKVGKAPCGSGDRIGPLYPRHVIYEATYGDSVPT